MSLRGRLVCEANSPLLPRACCSSGSDIAPVTCGRGRYLRRQSGWLLADGAMHASSRLEVDSEIAAVAFAFHVHAR